MDKNKISSIVFYFAILFFIIAFNFAHNPPSGWYQQFLPNLNNRPISDITFLDSLTAFAVTPYTANDTAYIIKTTNGGDNWNIIFRQPTNTVGGFNRVQFLNTNTGFACGNFFWKTTNSGLNWFNVNTSGIFPQSMYVLNEDTIWLTDDEGLVGGVFRTTNGGSSWQQQLYLGNQNPTNIYFYNKDIGFVAENVLYKTTNSGLNWLQIPGGGFGDMHFINATTGWKCYGPMQKTTDGGNSWQTLPLPPKSDTLPLSRVYNFSNVNADTIWGVGSVGVFGSIARALIYLTTNGGASWRYQLPDTSINIFQYFHIQFLNKSIGWAYGAFKGVHTVTGGDTTFYTGIVRRVSTIPQDFILHQNYPNPFNPRTIIPFSLKKAAFVKLTAYDITGKEVQRLVEGKYEAGEYEVDFMGKFSASGVYFYRLFIDTEKKMFSDSKTMILIK